MSRQTTGAREVGPQDPERVLVEACLRGDERAWESMVQSNGKRIFNICLRFTGRRDEAEDLTQEVFVRIYRSLRSFRSETGSFQSWILSVARNMIIDHYRKERRFHASLGSEEMEAMHLEDRNTLSPSRAFEQAEASRLLSKALVALKPDLRETVILRDLRGMSYQEVAETTGVSEGTVKSRLFRARLRLTRVFVVQGLLAKDLCGSVALTGQGDPAACCIE